MTTSALGLALGWPGRVLLAECDPLGRRVLPGFMVDRMRGSAGSGLLGLAMAAEADPQATLVPDDHVMSIVDDGRVELLHGLGDPRHGARLRPVWRRLAEALATRDGDVIADLGQIGGADTPAELLMAADAVILVLKPTLVQVDAAKPRLDALREVVDERAAVGACLIADGAYTSAEVERALGVPVLVELPFSRADAQVLSDGARPRLTFRTSLLVRSLDALGRRVRAAVTESETVRTGIARPVSPATTEASQ
ncbi:hypothetical protein [Actinomadura roseirufa]|uniref:hypothetical protein n=1 Tax=Actinomadura roseirufa TaxID=2094049 RepID=UPI0010411DAD|nr:hypothetical protein [Actinomadura roseirufa]